MQLRPYSLFFFFALVFLVFFAFHPDEWFCYAYVLAVLVGFIWSLIPRIFQTDYPFPIQHLPMITLFICLFALVELRERPISETMFFTFSALILFRTLMFVLKTFRDTTIALSGGISLLLLGLAIEMGVSIFHVIATLKSPPEIPDWVNLLSVRLAGILIILGWSWFQKRFSWALLPALVIIFIPPFGFAKYAMIALGAGFMWETRHYFKTT